MKKILTTLCASALFSTLMAQSPAISFTNLSGTSQITCITPSINILAAVVNYTNGGTFTFSWVGPQAMAPGSNVAFNQPGTYTVIAFNALNNFSIVAPLTAISVNTVTPITNVSPTSQNIVCNIAAVTFTGSSNLSNVTHAWTSPSTAVPALGSGASSFFSPVAVGVFTHCVTDNSNGCSSCKTVTVTSSPGVPTASTTSMTQFSIGCGTYSVTDITIQGASTTNPMGGVLTTTLLPPGFSGSYFPGPFTGYTVNLPGTYTLVLRDNNTFCEAQIPITIFQNISNPLVSVNAPTLTCYQPNAILTATSNVAASFAWINGPITVPGASIQVNLNTSPASSIAIVYTLVTTGAVNSCKSTNIYVIYQDQFKPNVLINGATALTCANATVNLTLGIVSPTVSTFPPPGIIASAWYGPAPQASLANSSNYLAYTPGTYTMIALNLNNGCTAPATITVADNRIFPMVSAPPPFNINCPNNTADIFALVTGPSGGLTYSWTGSSIVSPANTATVTVNAPGIYTLAVTGQSNCTSQVLIQVAVCAAIDAGLIADNAFVLFPNPVNDQLVLEIKISHKNMTMEIWSASGELARTVEIREETTTISLQNEQNGLYLVRLLEGGKTVKAAKILKN